MTARLLPTRDGRGTRRTLTVSLDGRITHSLAGRATHPVGFHPVESSDVARLRGLVGGGFQRYAGINRFRSNVPAPKISLPFDPTIPPAEVIIKGKAAPLSGARHMVTADALTDDPLHEFAVRISDFYAGVAPQVRTRLEELFGLSEFGTVCDRAKTRKSVYMKLNREVIEGAKIENINDALEAINDGYGIKLVCTDATREGMLKVLRRFVQQLPAEDVRLVRLRHYQGPGVKPYLNRFWLSEFGDVLSGMGYNPKVVSGLGGMKNSGFTSFQVDMEVDVYRGGARYPVKVDMHFRGPHVDRVNDTEHLLLSILRQGRVLDKTLTSYPPLEEIVSYLHVLTDEEAYALDHYMLSLYRSARLAELEGERFWSPNLVAFPSDYLGNILRFTNVETIYREARDYAKAEQVKATLSKKQK